MDQTDYYVSRRDRLLRDLGKFSGLLVPQLSTRYGSGMANQLLQGTLTEFERLIPQFPYIGGRANPLTTNLVQAGYGLALYRVLQRQNGTLEEAGELIHLAMERRLDQIPAFLRHWMAQLKYSPRRIRKLKARAKESQLRRYPGDWVFEVIDGGGKTFDVGIDYIECGIEKFMRSQGAAELIPYLCNTDYVLFRAVGMGLTRTKTLAWGCDRCDFRIARRGSVPPAWPPQFAERTCGQGEKHGTLA